MNTCDQCGQYLVNCTQCGHSRAVHDSDDLTCIGCSCPRFIPDRAVMAAQQFDLWAYRKLQEYLADTHVTAEEKRGFDRVKAFLTGLESDRQVLVKD